MILAVHSALDKAVTTISTYRYKPGKPRLRRFGHEFESNRTLATAVKIVRYALMASSGLLIFS
jgi:hypothetical protein